MVFGVNTSPFAGREGRFVTSRQVRERLLKEAKHNMGIRVEETENPEHLRVCGRGELQLAILIEMMRREGYELQVSRPEIVTKDIGGVLHEPVEVVIIDCPEEHLGVVTQKLGTRRGKMVRMTPDGHGRVRLEFRVPTRGLIGYRGEFLTDTRGTGMMHQMFESYMPWQGPISESQQWRAGGRPDGRDHDLCPVPSAAAWSPVRRAWHPGLRGDAVWRKLSPR